MFHSTPRKSSHLVKRVLKGQLMPLKTLVKEDKTRGANKDNGPSDGTTDVAVEQVFKMEQKGVVPSCSKLLRRVRKERYIPGKVSHC